MAKYYTLIVREADGTVGPQFGDFDRQCVEDERQEYRDQGYKAKDLAILITKNATRAEIIRAFEAKYNQPFPCKTPKEKWKASHSDFRKRLRDVPLGDRYIPSECTFRVNGRAIEYTVTATTFSIQTEPETMRDGLFSRSELHANINVCMEMGWICRDTLKDMRTLNARSFRLGFKLP